MSYRPAFTTPFYYLVYASIGTGILALIVIVGALVIKRAPKIPAKVIGDTTSMTIWVKKETTLCSEPWFARDLGPDIYFRSLGVDISDTIVRQTGSRTCMDCTCLSGDTLYLEIAEADFRLLTGFTRSEKPK